MSVDPGSTENGAQGNSGRFAAALRHAAIPVLLVAVVIAAGWVGYLLLDNAARPMTIGAFVVFVVAVGADLVTLHFQHHGTNERVQEAQDSADKAVEAAHDAKIAAGDAAALLERIALHLDGREAPSNGKHAKGQR